MTRMLKTDLIRTIRTCSQRVHSRRTLALIRAPVIWFPPRFKMISGWGEVGLVSLSHHSLSIRKRGGSLFSSLSSGQGPITRGRHRGQLKHVRFSLTAAMNKTPRDKSHRRKPYHRIHAPQAFSDEIDRLGSLALMAPKNGTYIKLASKAAEHISRQVPGSSNRSVSSDS